MLGATHYASFVLCIFGNDCGLVMMWLLMQVLLPVIDTELLRGAEWDHFSETVSL